MSWLSRLFGGEASRKAEDPAATLEHRGFTIEARPYRDGGQYQTAGVVWKIVDGERREHSFIRADRFQSLDDAASHALVKGRQIVDEQGDRLFR